MPPLSSQQALRLAAEFAITADYIRTSDAAATCQIRAKMLETASRAAFLRAQSAARDEEICPAFGQLFRRAAFAVA